MDKYLSQIFISIKKRATHGPSPFALNKTLAFSNPSRGCITSVSLNQQTLFFLFPHSLCLSLSINAIPFVENLEISTSESTLSIKIEGYIQA